MVSIAVPVYVGAGTVGAVMLSTDDSEIDAARRTPNAGLIIVAGISLLAAAVAAMFMAGSVTGPLRQLRTAPSASPAATSPSMPMTSRERRNCAPWRRRSTR